VKYIYKYILKGSDRSTLETMIDEIKKYVTGRYIESSEAV
jgi:hypothetical protein